MTRPISRRWFATHSRTLLLGLITLGLVAGGLLLTPTGAAAAGTPSVVSGRKAGPVAIPSPRAKTVARLRLPKGAWFVTAKAQLYNVGDASPHAGVNCRLRVGSRSDLVSAAPKHAIEAGASVPMLLTIAGRLGKSGKAKLICVGEVADVLLLDIRMTAMKVGRLTTAWAGGIKHTGSGKPWVITGRRAIDEVNGDGEYHDVAAIPLPKGRWWILAKGVGGAADTGGFFDCRLLGGDALDVVSFGLKPRSGPSDMVPIALQVVAHVTASPAYALLQCRGPDGFDVSDIAITAVRSGKLTNRPLAGGPAVMGGKGAPRVISGWLDGPTDIPVGTSFSNIAEMALPAGRWMIIATASFVGGLPIASDLRVLCRIGLKGQSDQAFIDYGADRTRVAPLVMSLARRTTRAETLRLKCRRTDPWGSGQAVFVKLTALKAAALSIKGL